jgi:hypothetical protein
MMQKIQIFTLCAGPILGVILLSYLQLRKWRDGGGCGNLGTHQHSKIVKVSV